MMVAAAPMVDPAAPVPDAPQPAAPEHGEWLRRAMLASKPFLVKRQRPVVHNLINLAALSADLAVAVLALSAARLLPGWGHVLVAGPVLAVALYTLIAFVVHEASHDMFIVTASPARTRRWNRFFGWCCALPFAIHYEKHWEKGHIVHHVRPLEPDDPQQFNCSTGRALLCTLLLLVFVPGYAFFHRYLDKKPQTAGRTSKGVMVAFVVILTALLGGSGLVFGWSASVALFWGLQMVSALNQLKGAFEHGGAFFEEPELLLRSRSTIPALRWPFSIWNATIYHFEHHLSARVPWYELPAYHRAIREMVPPALREDVYNRRLWAQLAGRIGRHGQGVIFG